MQDEPVTEADRKTVINLFKEIAEYGNRVRERRAMDAVAQRENLRNKKSKCDVEETSKAT